MEFYAVVKKDDIMNFAGKRMELVAIMLNEVTQSQKKKVMNGLPHSWMLTSNPQLSGKLSKFIVIVHCI